MRFECFSIRNKKAVHWDALSQDCNAMAQRVDDEGTASAGMDTEQAVNIDKFVNALVTSLHLSCLDCNRMAQVRQNIKRKIYPDF